MGLVFYAVHLTQYVVCRYCGGGYAFQYLVDVSKVFQPIERTDSESTFSGGRTRAGHSSRFLGLDKTSANRHTQEKVTVTVTFANEFFLRHHI